MKATNLLRTIIPLFLILLMLGLTFGCQNQVEEGLTKEDVQKIIERELEIVNDGKLELIKEHITSDYVTHNTKGEMKALSIEDYEKMTIQKRADITNFKVTVKKTIFQNDMIVTLAELNGINTGRAEDDPTGGKKLHLQIVQILRIVDGKVAESWLYFDNRIRLEQLGFSFSLPSVEEEVE